MIVDSWRHISPQTVHDHETSRREAALECSLASVITLAWDHEGYFHDHEGFGTARAIFGGGGCHAGPSCRLRPGSPTGHPACPAVRHQCSIDVAPAASMLH